MKLLATFVASAVAAVSLVPEVVDAHAFLLLPKAEFVTVSSERNRYAYTVAGDKVPPASSYTTGDAEKNAQGFKTNYKKLNPASLKAFILANQAPAQGSGIPSGGTPECGLSKPDIAPLPLPDHLEFGNYKLETTTGIHPGPCEAWCDNEIVVPFTEDCRTILNKPITYDKAKCQGKKRLTFYWLATHSPPFQVYTDCAPIQGGASSGGGGGNSTATTGGSTQAGNRNGGSSVGSEAAPAPATSTAKNGGSGTAGTSGNAGTPAASNTNSGTKMWNTMGSSNNNNGGGWNGATTGGSTNKRSTDGTDTSSVGKVMPFPGWQ